MVGSFFFRPFSALKISCSFLLACKVLAEKSANRLIGVPVYVTSCFSLAAFKILSLIFDFLIILCFGVVLLRFLFSGTLGFLNLDVLFLLHVGKVFSHYVFVFFFHISSLPFFLSLLLLDPYNVNAIVPHMFLELSLL